MEIDIANEKRLLIRLVCPECKGTDFEVLDGESHPNVTLDIWRCRGCNGQISITIEYNDNDGYCVTEEFWNGRDE